MSWQSNGVCAEQRYAQRLGSCAACDPKQWHWNLDKLSTTASLRQEQAQFASQDCIYTLHSIQSAMFLLGAFAVLHAGMCCLSMLDTPTRFEKPKEAGRTD